MWGNSLLPWAAAQLSSDLPKDDFTASFTIHINSSPFGLRNFFMLPATASVQAFVLSPGFLKESYTWSFASISAPNPSFVLLLESLSPKCVITTFSSLQTSTEGLPTLHKENSNFTHQILHYLAPMYLYSFISHLSAFPLSSTLYFSLFPEYTISCHIVLGRTSRPFLSGKSFSSFKTHLNCHLLRMSSSASLHKEFFIL